jgi:hypothetical protein
MRANWPLTPFETALLVTAAMFAAGWITMVGVS